MHCISINGKAYHNRPTVRLCLCTEIHLLLNELQEAGSKPHYIAQYSVALTTGLWVKKEDE